MPKVAAKGGKKQKDKNAPKRASSAFILFSNDERPKVKAENPNIAFGEVAKVISERWKSADDKTKKKYEEKAAADKQRYQKEMDKYQKGGAAAQQDYDDDE